MAQHHDVNCDASNMTVRELCALWNLPPDIIISDAYTVIEDRPLGEGSYGTVQQIKILNGTFAGKAAAMKTISVPDPSRLRQALTELKIFMYVVKHTSTATKFN